MVLLLHICRNSVSRSKTSEGDHGYGLHLLDVFSYRGWGRQRNSEILCSMGRQFGTVCHQLCETAVCLWVWERSRGQLRRISLNVANNEYHSALLGRFVHCIVAPSVFCLIFTRVSFENLWNVKFRDVITDVIRSGSTICEKHLDAPHRSRPTLLSVQCNTLHGTEYKITCGVCLGVLVCAPVLGLNISKTVTDRGSVTMGH